MTHAEVHEQLKLVLQVLDRYRKGDVTPEGAKTLLYLLHLSNSQVDHIIHGEK